MTPKLNHRCETGRVLTTHFEKTCKTIHVRLLAIHAGRRFIHDKGRPCLPFFFEGLSPSLRYSPTSHTFPCVCRSLYDIWHLPMPISCETNLHVLVTGALQPLPLAAKELKHQLSNLIGLGGHGCLNGPALFRFSSLGVNKLSNFPSPAKESERKCLGDKRVVSSPYLIQMRGDLDACTPRNGLQRTVSNRLLPSYLALQSRD